MLTKTYIIMLASYAILKVTAKVWMDDLGILGDLPESNQLSLFDF